MSNPPCLVFISCPAEYVQTEVLPSVLDDSEIDNKTTPFCSDNMKFKHLLTTPTGPPGTTREQRERRHRVIQQCHVMANKKLTQVFNLSLVCVCSNPFDLLILTTILLPLASPAIRSKIHFISNNSKDGSGKLKDLEC